jgi:predicted nucleic acid-binding protein
METCLADTSYLLARALTTDPLHELAIDLELRTEVGYRFVTTDLIIIEFLDGLSRTPQKTREAGCAISRALRKNSKIKVVPLTPDLFEAALRIYESAEDKDWGMTDCVSFALMRKLKIHDALTYDHHFEQAGFRALLRDIN